YGELFARAANGVQRGEERPFRTLLVYRPAAHYHLAESRFINESGFERRRRPLGGIRLLHVVHVVKTESARSTSVQRGENAGLAVAPWRKLRRSQGESRGQDLEWSCSRSSSRWLGPGMEGFVMTASAKESSAAIDTGERWPLLQRGRVYLAGLIRNGGRCRLSF